MCVVGMSRHEYMWACLCVAGGGGIEGTVSAVGFSISVHLLLGEQWGI